MRAIIAGWCWITFVLVGVYGFAQPPLSCRIMFYNVENYFDPFDDTLTVDEEFTPGGERSWTYSRFMQKAVKIARVIIACGDPDPPVIVGLAEVENRFVLEKLVYETPLKPLRYGIVHKDSPDLRGIDVALIYKKDEVSVDTFFYVPVTLTPSFRPTREILIARCVVFDSDTIWVAVNHWPSRYGGAASSQRYREQAASVLRQQLENIFQEDSNANMILMGDFNDEPGDVSLKVLTSDNTCQNPSLSLINLMDNSDITGTMKYDGYWFTFDQIIVSSGLYENNKGLGIQKKKAAILRAAFLLEADNSHMGGKPFRTFAGPAYHSGFSDHLPVFLTIYKE
jgi:predicted extracellular nuclease